MKLGWVIPLLCAGTAMAQHYEVGGLVGYGFYRSLRVGASDVGIHDHLAAGALIGEDLYNHIGGEVRYEYQGGDPFVSGAGQRASLQGDSHSLHYDVLFHLRGKDDRLRPFAAVGAGGKYYRVTGQELVAQPGADAVELVRGSQWRFLADVGLGVKYRLRNHVMLRGEFRDYITPFPKKLFVPGSGSDHGLFQQFTPMFGLSYWF